MRRLEKRWRYVTIEAANTGNWTEIQFSAGTQICLRPNVILDGPEDLEGKTKIEECRRCRFWWHSHAAFLWFRGSLIIHF